MFDYERLKTAAYKYKYETALETESRRISYKELLEMTDAVYNSLCVANASGGNVAVLLRACPEAVLVYFACARAGFECVSADSRLSPEKAARLAKEYNPSVVILPSSESLRLGGIFSKHGCKTAVFTGEMPDIQIFPAQFGFDILLDKNNYKVSEKKREQRAGGHAFFDGNGYKDILPQEIFELPPREPIYIALPVYENAGSLALTELLYSGRRCFIPQTNDMKMFKRKKLCAVICDELSGPLYPERFRFVFTVKTDAAKPFAYAGGGTLYMREIEEKLSQTAGLPVQCRFDGVKIRIAVLTDDINASDDSALVKKLANACSDILYAYNMPKSLVFVTKTV